MKTSVEIGVARVDDRTEQTALVSEDQSLDALVSSYKPSRGEVFKAMSLDVYTSAKSIASDAGKALSYLVSAFYLPTVIREADSPPRMMTGLIVSILSLTDLLAGYESYNSINYQKFISDSHPVLYTWLAANAVSGAYELGRYAVRRVKEKYAAVEKDLVAKKVERVRAARSSATDVVALYDSFIANGGNDEEFSAHYDKHLAAQSSEASPGVKDINDLEARVVCERQQDERLLSEKKALLQAYETQEQKLNKIGQLLKVHS